jgi:hypothetical protein
VEQRVKSRMDGIFFCGFDNDPMFNIVVTEVLLAVISVSDQLEEKIFWGFSFCAKNRSKSRLFRPVRLRRHSRGSFARAYSFSN